MTAIANTEPDLGWSDGDATTDYLTQVLATVGGLATTAGMGPVDDAVRVDRIQLLTKIKAAAAAAEAVEIVGLARSQVAAQQTAGVDYRRLGQGIGEQVALATRTSAWQGARTMTFARGLVQELPQLCGLLAAGRVSEHVARLIVTETSHLDGDRRRDVDRQLLVEHVDELGPKGAAGLARKLAYAADPQSAVRRARYARRDRRVSLRPAPDTMTWFTALLPVEDGVACLAALTRQADAAKARGDDRTRGQIMADTVTGRVTGRDPADGQPVALNLTVPLDHLINPDNQAPGDLPGYGPIPAGLVDDIVTKAKDRIAWRRLFTAPTGDGGTGIVGGDPTARRFTGWLAALIKLRDGGVCREPYCDAPVRHLDHIRPHADGGPTTHSNGRGLCERHNHTRQLPGWQAETIAYDRHGHPTLTATTTPTGHTYLSRAPDPP